MKKLLHIIASPRGDESRTLKVSEIFMKNFKKKYPDCEIDELNVFKEELIEMTVKKVSGKYVLLGGKDLDGELKDEWNEIIKQIDRFLSADAYLISTPMWNFGIPYPLKHYIDIILQPKYTFQYTATGVKGFAEGKKMVVITSRGGDYGPDSPTKSYNQQEPYLRTAFGFIGLTDIAFIAAQPMDALGPEVRDKKIEEAKIIAEKFAQEF